MAKKKEKKEKKAGKRMSKKELAALLIDFFHAKSSETLSMKYIFSELRLTTHPQKMLCVDILHDLLADDYIPLFLKEEASRYLWPNAIRHMP